MLVAEGKCVWIRQSCGCSNYNILTSGFRLFSLIAAGWNVLLKFSLEHPHLFSALRLSRLYGVCHVFECVHVCVLIPENSVSQNSQRGGVEAWGWNTCMFCARETHTCVQTQGNNPLQLSHWLSHPKTVVWVLWLHLLSALLIQLSPLH